MYLHATDHKSNLKIGVDAFILIWAQLKYWKFLSILLKTPVVYSIAKITYKLFANYRFKRLHIVKWQARKLYSKKCLDGLKISNQKKIVFT